MIALARKLLRVAATAWLVFGVFVVFAGVFEWGSRGFVAARRTLRGETTSAAALDIGPGIEAYADREQGLAWLRELEEARRPRVSPFLLSTGTPYQGRWIVVGEDGRRRTVHPGAPGPGALRVWTLGGSAMWGWGVPDDATIGSNLARMLTDAGHEAIVENLAQRGYVSTQSLLMLLFELGRGVVPDVVVLLDGFNDLGSVLRGNEPGWPAPGVQRAQRFEVVRSGARPVDDLARASFLELLRGTRDVVGGGRRGLAIDRRAWKRRPVDDVVGEVVEVWLANVRMVEQLARTHGFRALCCWQPSVLTRDPLSDAERTILAQRSGKEVYFDRAAELAHSAEFSSSHLRCRDLSAALDGLEGTVYLDVCHPASRGYEVLAREMADEVLGLLESPGKE